MLRTFYYRAILMTPLALFALASISVVLLGHALQSGRPLTPELMQSVSILSMACFILVTGALFGSTVPDRAAQSFHRRLARFAVFVRTETLLIRTIRFIRRTVGRATSVAGHQCHSMANRHPWLINSFLST